MKCFGEPSLGDALADPIIRAVMAADHVDPEALASSLRETALRVGQAGALRGKCGSAP
jgi:hypothetical protein